MLRTVVGMFEDTADTHRAVDALRREGFPQDRVSVVVRDRHDPAFSASGSLLGEGVAPNKATTRTMDDGAAPAARWQNQDPETVGLGTVVAAGALARAIGGAGVGVAAGGLAGSLSDIGIPNDLARDLVDRVRAGRESMLVLTVEMEKADDFARLMVDNGAGVVYRGVSRTSAYAEGERAASAVQRGL